MNFYFFLLSPLLHTNAGGRRFCLSCFKITASAWSFDVALEGRSTEKVFLVILTKIK